MLDARGLEITAGSHAARDAVDDFCDELLSMGTDSGRILQAAEAHPDCPIAQVDAAVIQLYGCTRPSREASKIALERARRAARLPREIAWTDIVADWLRGDFEAVLDGCEAITREWPRDLVAAKVAEFHYYLTGQYWNGPRFLKHAERIAEENADSPHFASMHAFALELCERPDEALHLATAAIEREAHNPWGHHAVAHAYSRRAEPERGGALMKEFSGTWNDAGVAVRSHNFWHLGVLQIDQMQLESALALHTAEIFASDRELAGIQLDAISLLWRIEMAGREISDDAWAHVTQATLALAGDFPMPYAAAHHAYLFARTGEGAALDATLEAAQHQAETSPPDRRKVWTRGGLDLVEGCASYGRGDAKAAFASLGPHIERVAASGGSDAQVDLFHQTYFQGLLQAGEKARAGDWFKRRTRERPPTPLEEHWADRLG